MEGELMTKTNRLGPIAAFTVFAAISLPQSCDAQSIFQPPPLVINGVGSLSVQEYQASQLIGSSFSSNEPATLILTYEGFSPDVYANGLATLQIDVGSVGLPPPYPLYASGDATYQQFEDADLSLNAFGRDGFSASIFKTSDGSIVADVTDTDFPITGPQYVFQATFQSVPEPSSLLLAATGFLMILIFAAVRHFFLARRKARPGIERRSSLLHIP
jgi:PEP-CTERM motif